MQNRKIIQFGENVAGYDIPVLNEREIRAASGLLFLLMFITILIVIMKGNFVPLKFAVTIFLTDILVRVLISPRFSPSLIIGRWIVRNQVPEYVGAAQKKFAWIIGIVLAVIMFALQVVVVTHHIIFASSLHFEQPVRTQDSTYGFADFAPRPTRTSA